MKKRIVFCLLALLTGIGSVYADITIKAKVPAEWTNNIYVNLYNSGTANGWYNTTQDGDWHVFTYSGSETTINAIFVSTTASGTWPTYKHFQTTNITPITSDKCIEISFNETESTANTSKSTWANTDCPAEMVSVYFVNTFGWSEVHMHTWNPKLEGNGTYGVLMTNTGTSVGGYDVYEYSLDASQLGPCLFDDGAWGKYEHQTDNTTMVENAGMYYVKGSWYESLEACEEVILGTNFYLVGSMVGWSSTDYRFMKETEEATEASVSVTINAYSNITFKLKDNGAWRGCDPVKTITKDDNTVTILSDKEGKNVEMTPYAAGDYIFTLNLENRLLTVTYPDGEQMEIPTNIYLSCDVLNNWATANENYKFDVDEENDEATFSVTLDEQTDYAFKLVYNDAWFGANYNFNYYWNTDVLFTSGGATANLYAFKEGTYTFRYNLISSKLTIEFPHTSATSISVGSYEYATLFSTTAYEVPDEVEAYIITDCEGIKLTMERVWRIPAETGVLLHAAQGSYDFYEGDGRYMGVDVSANLMKGSVTDEEINNEAVHYVLSYDEDYRVGLFWPYGTGATNGVGAFTNGAGKAYLELNPQTNAGAPRRGFLFTAQEDTYTALDEVIPSSGNAKRLVNGQLFILHQGKIYNAQGARLR